MSASTAPVISLVIPVFGEGEHLRAVAAAVSHALERTGRSHEIIFVDDGSSDDTWAVLGDVCGELATVRALRLSRNFGKEAALCAGLERARGQAVIVMDGDLQHPPELIPKMVSLWEKERYQVVEGIKASRGKESLPHRLTVSVFYRLLDRLSGYRLSDASDFKLLDRRAVEAWKRLGEHSVFFRGMVAWLGLRTVQIPFEVADRIGGRSGWSFVRLIRLAVTALTAFSSLPLHLVGLLGIVFLGMAVVLAIQTLYVWAAGAAVTGFTTVILLLLILGGALMCALGIIGEYIARIYDEVKGRPRYLILQELGATEAQGLPGSPDAPLGYDRRGPDEGGRRRGRT